MVAEGYNASKCIYLINKEIEAEDAHRRNDLPEFMENVKSGKGLNKLTCSSDV